MKSTTILNPARKEGVYFIRRITGGCSVWSAAIWNPCYGRQGSFLWDGPLPPYGDGIVDPATIIEVFENELTSLAGVPFGLLTEAAQ